MAGLCILLAAACGYDYWKNKIPNYLILLMAVLGAGQRFQNGGFSGLFCYLGQAVLIMALMFPFFKIGSVGAGDVKLLGVTAGYLPFGKILSFLFVSMLIAAAVSLTKMWKNKCFRERLQYLAKYLAEVFGGEGWHLYLDKREEKCKVGICLSGPVLLGILLYLGGVY